MFQRLIRRMKGQRRIDGVEIEGLLSIKHIYVHDPIMIKVRSYVKKNYKWIITTLLAIIAILVAIIVIPWGVELSNKAEKDRIDRITPDTVTYFYLPHGNNIDIKTAQKDSKCWGSIASNRYDAYRCAVGNIIYDPCFMDNSGLLDCPINPKESRLFKIDVIEKNNFMDQEKREQIPWYIVLDGGYKCQFYTGATDLIAGNRIDYGCDNGSVLSLPIVTKTPINTIKCSSAHNEILEMCKLKEIWY